MSKILFTGYLLLSAGLSCAAPFSPTDLPSWPRMSAPIFGCQLEQRGGYKDADFNCANRKQRRDWGNVCHITRFSYAGPQLSPALARQLHPLIKDVRLEWEYGRLQTVTVAFNKIITPKTLHTVIPGLKLDQPYQRPNLMDASLQQCEQNASCLVLQGFEHLGGADADCEH